MTSEQPARASEKKILTGARIALAALTFSLLAIAISSSCNPTDSSRVGSTNAPTSPPAAKISPRQPNPQASRAATPSSPEDALTDEQRNAAMTTLDGKGIKLSDYEGKVVILNVWATWCGPCRKEIPEFVAMRKEFSAGDVEILGVTMEDERNTVEGVKEFVEEFGIDYRIAWADLDFYKTILSPGYQIPQTYVLGRDGRVLYKFVGYNSQVGDHVRAIVNQSLGE